MADRIMSPIKPSPERFSEKPYKGIHLFEDERGNWLIWGHHTFVALLISCLAWLREEGILEDDYSSAFSAAAAAAHLDKAQQRWANNFREDSDGWLMDWCESDAPGAVPVTEVRS